MPSLKCVLVLICFWGVVSGSQAQTLAVIPANSNATIFVVDCRVDSFVVDVKSSLPVTFLLTLEGKSIAMVKSDIEFKYSHTVPKETELQIINPNGISVPISGIIYTSCENNLVITIILCIVIILAIIVGVGFTAYLSIKYQKRQSEYQTFL